MRLLQGMKAQIPPLVREIWGKQSEILLSKLREQQVMTGRLIRGWQDAEHRLIAVANSLTTLKAGQKLVSVGIPLAAAHLMHPDASAQCYHAAMPGRRSHPAASLDLSLGQLHDVLIRLARALTQELSIALRGAFLFFLFLPVILTSPASALSEQHRSAWIRLGLWTLERAGPAFIKWGQWAATRRDLFPGDVCDSLTQLQTKAPAHGFAHTRSEVEAAFGCPVEQLFAEFDLAPVASGSIAQVHKAVLTEEGARRAQSGGPVRGGLLPLPARRRAAASFALGTPVAVKVRHPGVDTVLEKDVVLMQRLALLASKVPGLGGPQIKESVMQFGAPLREQLDLTAEAASLARFGNNFKWWRGVQFPLPAAAPLVAPGVLVESFEEGVHVSSFMQDPDIKHGKTLAGLGLGCYLKMLLKDNFIHADMHPGNILVRLEAPTPGSWTAALANTLGLDLRLPRLVLLDVGMTAHLSSADQNHLMSFFGGLASMDGGAVADAIMRFSEAALPNPAAFRADMAGLFEGLDPEHLRLNTQDVMADMMDSVRKHGVHLRGAVTTVIVTSMVLEGWSTKLDPDIRILETVRGLLPEAKWQRAALTADRIMRRPALAMA